MAEQYTQDLKQSLAGTPAIELFPTCAQALWPAGGRITQRLTLWTCPSFSSLCESDESSGQSECTHHSLSQWLQLLQPLASIKKESLSQDGAQCVPKGLS